MAKFTNIAAILFIAVTASACMQYKYDQKLNVVEDRPDELSITPPQDCPNWREPAEGDGLNHLHTNYGCATVTNYGVMVTNPRDLIKGRGADSDSERSRLAVRAYNLGAPSDASAGGLGGGGAVAPSE